jgi:hypothetical protein
VTGHHVQLKEEHMIHLLSSDNGVYTCALCGWKWRSKPNDDCPGLPRYDSGQAKVVGLATVAELRRIGLRPAPGQQPIGCLLSEANGPFYKLYDRAKAVEKRCQTPAQRRTALANLEKARQTLTCVDCGRHYPRKGTLDQHGRCANCAQTKHIHEAGRTLREKLAELAMAEHLQIRDLQRAAWQMIMSLSRLDS